MIERLRRSNSKPEKTQQERLSLRRKVMVAFASLGMLLGAAHLANAEGGSSCDPVIDNGCIENPENPTETTTQLTKPSVPETSVPETSVPEPSVPETSVPEPSVPETSVPETSVPETSVPETTTTYVSHPPEMPPTTIKNENPAVPSE